MNTTNQAQLAKKIGVSRQYISSILLGKKKVGAKMAKRLEDATCVSRLAWMYPDEYPNPFVSTSPPTSHGSVTPKNGDEGQAEAQ